MLQSRVRTCAVWLLVALADIAGAQVRVNVDVDRRSDEPRITQFRRVRRFGWHSGTHYGPYIDGRKISRVGWHTGSHLDWYTIDVPVLSKVDDADWETYVNFGKHTLRMRGDADRVVRESAVVGATGGTMLGWLSPDGMVIAGGPATPFRKRFVGNGWEGSDLGNSIIMMDLPGSPGVEVYLKQRTKDLDPRKKEAYERDLVRILESRRANAERDALLDDADQKFVRGLYPQAALLYQKAMKTDENDPVARFAVAHSLFALGVYKTAGQNVRYGLDKFPDWGLVNLDLTKFYKEPGLFDGKLADLRKYVAAHADDPDARLLLGYCLYFSGSRDEGLKVFDEMLKAPGGDRHAEVFVKLTELVAEAEKRPK